MNREPVAVATGTYRPKLSLYHASAKGTGAAIELELHPAHDQVDGSLFVRLANQLSVGDLRGATPVYPRFDWTNAITVKLDFGDLSQMLQVFRGECETINDDKGLFHESPGARTAIKFRHMIEPICGYSLEIYRTTKSTGVDSNARFFFQPSEATGIAAAIEGAMSVIAFGIPKVIPRDTAEYRAEARRMRDASAA